jgi:RimJ/RimL family protein N-acetyltransferase
MTPEAAPRLPDPILERSRNLPRKPDAVTLAGKHVCLSPLILEQDSATLHSISNGSPCRLGERIVEAYDAEALIWRYMHSGPFDSAEAMQDYLKPQVEAVNGLCLCVFDHASRQPVGVVNYMNNFPEHLKIELGSIWYSPLVQRTPVNTEVTYLLLRHAFAQGYRRVEWKCDTRNERSRQAALRMGFTFEGIQEAHFIIKGRNRDTAWYRILDHEWADVQRRLESLLYTTAPATIYPVE